MLCFQDIPGKPFTIKVGSSWVIIGWKTLGDHKQANYFQISIKTTSEVRWTTLSHQYERKFAELNNLKSNTEYLVRVKMITPEGESPYSPTSQTIKTKESPACKLVKKSFLETKGNPTPSVYAIPVKVLRWARNETAKTRKLEISMYFLYTTSVIKKQHYLSSNLNSAFSFCMTHVVRANKNLGFIMLFPICTSGSRAFQGSFLILNPSFYFSNIVCVYIKHLSLTTTL